MYKAQRNRQGDTLTEDRRWLMIAAAALGALAGARVLGILEQAPAMGVHWMDLSKSGGKTIVGGLLGGWIAVEVAKKLSRVHSRTGDLFAVPLCVGIAVGRLGCFFAGLADDTYGTPTALPWAVDFGDGVHRHPTQIYEFLFLAALAALLWHWQGRPHREGQIFRAFMAGYLGWRLVIDSLKPQPTIHGLSCIQWAALGGLVWLSLERFAVRKKVEHA